MIRVDVDFNERDRQGHVVARVPGQQVTRLTPNRQVYLYDPLERLWAEATVARINPDTRIAAFDVDWHSFDDADVADLKYGEAEWFISVPTAAGQRLASMFAENSTPTRQATVKLHHWVSSIPGAHIQLSDWHTSESTAGTQAEALP
jgi:hypothetical protein